MNIMDYLLAGWIANIIGVTLITIFTFLIMMNLGLVEGEKFSQDIKVLKGMTRTDFLYKITVLGSYLVPFYLLYMSVIYIILIKKVSTSNEYINALIKYEKYQIYRSFKENKDVR